jgi:AcrR family transcriptional regulator
VVESAHPGLRERKNARTRDSITRAACELILERGWQGATIALIAARADVSPRTVHTWFHSKDDIIFRGVDEPLGRLEDVLAAGTGDTLDRVHQWLAGEVAHVHDDDDFGLLRRRAVQSDAYLRSLATERLATTEQAVVRAIARDTGTPADSPAAQALGTAVMRLLLGLKRPDGGEPSGDDPRLVEGLAMLRGALDALRAHHARD